VAAVADGIHAGVNGYLSDDYWNFFVVVVVAVGCVGEGGV